MHSFIEDGRSRLQFQRQPAERYRINELQEYSAHFRLAENSAVFPVIIQRYSLDSDSSPRRLDLDSARDMHVGLRFDSDLASKLVS